MKRTDRSTGVDLALRAVGKGGCMQSEEQRINDTPHTDINNEKKSADPAAVSGWQSLTIETDRSAQVQPQNPAEADIKVSVIVPIYNAEAFLRPAMDSILDQKLREIEVICVDDGSTDGSLKIIKEYQKQDSRIRIATQSNAGPGMARNNGLRRARGEYVIFLDADDFFKLEFLSEMYETA